MASRELINIIIKATDQASATAKKVDNNIKNMGNSVSRLSKIPAFDNMKNKLSNVAQTIDGRFGGALTKARNRFNNLRTSVGNVTSTIKGKFGGAIDGIRNKLTGLGGGAKNVGSSFGFLRGAASMAAGMIGYDLLSSLMETTKASLNARSSIQSFGQRLNMSSAEVSSFQADLDKLQQTYKKIDMDVVGQQAMDMAYRLQLPKKSLTELTETSAIFTDAFIRNGRSSEDATLALADAMDGEFKRLKEIGISKEDLMKNGWNGNLEDEESLLHGINGALKQQHYDVLAQSVDNLDDAWRVLSITLSNLLESILVPLTPALAGVVMAITDAVNGIKSAWEGLPDWGKTAIAIGGVALAVGMIVPAITAVGVTGIPIIGGLITAIGAISLPVVAVVAAIGLLAYGIYEVGKAFGWWKDVGSMVDHIGKGIVRLWNAFINHPDVQGFIKDASQAFGELITWISGAWQETLKFFGVSTSSNWDIVSDIIHGIGDAWNDLKPIIVPVAQLLFDRIKGLAKGVLTLIDGIKFLAESFQSFTNDPFAAIAGFFLSYIETVKTGWVNIITGIVNLLSGFASAALTAGVGAGGNFVRGVTNWLSQLPGRILTYLSTSKNHIATQTLQWLQISHPRAMQLLTGIVNVLKVLPGRMLAILAAVGRHILSQGMQWIVNAKTRATGVVNGVISLLTLLPGKVLSALAAVVKSIAEAGLEWISTAKDYASKIVSAIVDGLSGIGDKVGSALGGVKSAVQNALSGALDTARSYASQINNTISNISARPSGWGGYDLDANGNPIIETGTGRHDVLDVNISLKDVPDGVDETFLVEVITSRSVIDALVNNQYYQSANSTANLRYQGKVLRSG